MAHPRQTATQGSGDLTGTHVFIFRQELNDREGYGVSEQATETRLPVASLFHAACVSRFRNSAKMKQLQAQVRQFWDDLGRNSGDIILIRNDRLTHQPPAGDVERFACGVRRIARREKKSSVGDFVMLGVFAQRC